MHGCDLTRTKDTFHILTRFSLLISNYHILTPCFASIWHRCAAGLVNILDSGDSVTVSNGQFQVSLQSSLPKIYYPSDSHGEPQL